MDRSEAADLLRAQMTAYARRTRAELESLVGQGEAYTVAGADGVEYQVEVDVVWDDQPGGTLRLIASIDDGGLRSAFRPLTEDFLSHPDGSVDLPDRS